jgi:hypothetical protein
MGVYADLSLLTEDQQREVARRIEEAKAQALLEFETSETLKISATRQMYITLAKETLIENKKVLPADQREVTAQEIVDFAAVLASGNPTT